MCRCILVNNQPDSLFHVFIYSFHLSTCFEHQVPIIRRSNCINTSSGMISLCKWLLGMPALWPAYQAVSNTLLSTLVGRSKLNVHSGSVFLFVQQSRSKYYDYCKFSSHWRQNGIEHKALSFEGKIVGNVLLLHITLQTGRSWVRFPMVSLEFFSDIIFPVALWPWGRLSL
jgi:hypothetical protein